MKRVRLGAGAGYGGDRIDPALELVTKGDIQYLIYECLAERTIALHQQEKLTDPQQGYSPGLERRLREVLRPSLERGVKIITNMGAANPQAAAEKVVNLAREIGLAGVTVAAVIGDDVLDWAMTGEGEVLETGESLSDYTGRMVSANAYLGAEPLVEALRREAQVIITGRVADPALFLAPLVHEYGWGWDDYDRLGQGTVIGHLLECAGQVTGGYFADPGYKEVPRLWDLGFPIAEVAEDGEALITKPPGSGGLVTLASCKEQLLYEIHDPSAYMTPDVVADFTQVSMSEAGPDRVVVKGGRGWDRPSSLKVSVGYRDSFVGEGEIGYAGPGALERVKLAAEVVRKRLEKTAPQLVEVRYDLVGINSLHGPWLSRLEVPPYEVRLRVAGRASTREVAARVGEEVESLWTNGPAGGGGATRGVREVVGIVSTMIPRLSVSPRLIMMSS